MAPVWSAMTDAYAKKDFNWMKSLYRRLMFLFRLTIVALIVLVIVSPFAYKIWLRGSVDTSLGITILVGVYVLIRVWHMMHATLVNGMGLIKFQMYVVIVQLALFPILAYFLGHNFMLVGIIISNCIIVLISGLSLSVQVRKILSQNASGILLK